MGRDSRRAQRPPVECYRGRGRRCGTHRMISSAIIPQPLARLPWRLIFLVAGIAGIGITTLYSAAGGAAQPWATKQAIVILFFLTIAIGMSWTSESTIKQAAFP